MTSISVVEEQMRALKVLLNLNNKDLKNRSEPIWRILVYDRRGQDIIAPVLNNKELRDIGVVLHLSLHSERDSVPDAAAVYFVIPSEENVLRISQDLQKGLYDHYYLNFISPIPSPLIEQLALACLQAETQNVIKKVMDQYLDFISLEDDMFILRQHGREEISYYAINRADVNENEMRNVTDKICNGLFAFFATLGIVPIIRCSKDNAADMVAQKLNKKLKSTLQDVKMSSLFKGNSFTDLNNHRPLTLQRPLLIILDRNMDMATPLYHSWLYQPLIHDVLSLKLNTVRIEETDERGRKKTQSYDLNRDDEFWQRHKGTPFPQVAESVQKELESYKNQEENVKQLKSNMDDVGNSYLGDNTAKLTSAVNSLPELLKRKTLIDMHTTIAHSILDQIKKRKLDNFIEIEEKILTKAVDKTLDKSPLDLVKDSTGGAERDKLRLSLINFLCASMSDDEVKEYERALEEAGCDIYPLNYLKRWKTIARMPSPASRVGKAENMLSKLMTQGSQFVLEGVKNLVVKKFSLPITRVVHDLMDNKNQSELEECRYFDPKLSESEMRPPENQGPFQEAIVFVVGGGNYIEYQNIIDSCKKNDKKPKKIIYGCTDLVDADQFIEQLSKLGHELSK
ncbi:sec1 family domain containing Slh [Brevipalpus obovatus]|uniref:sec1 family domain containing Slh n=1 Tax=Brevipalpus obovatus TaxID=246614 RepID=UPI003D9DE595